MNIQKITNISVVLLAVLALIVLGVIIGQGDEYIESDDFGHFPPLWLLYVLSSVEKNVKGVNLFFKDCILPDFGRHKTTI